ncbi:MAG: hypothetical protein HeimC2_38450 [Candidatus Heimdallarchaeota archaeon LC_2]|nr:MAG: hypothetical protein HeimC2_38450 [Candidatus Heimdallarchaeota archaeon LC_2]
MNIVDSQSIILRNTEFCKEMLSTSQDVDTQIINENLDDGFRKIVALITWIIILLIPAYSVTNTESGHFNSIKEKTFLWPWMILTQYTPSSGYNADQYAVVAFPWSFILFIPFLYALRTSWELYSNDEQKAIKSGFILVASIVQLFLISMTYKSQSPDAFETISIYYIPQLILIVFHGIIGFRWYTDELKQTQKR